MRVRLTTRTLESSRKKVADPYTMNQTRENPPVTKYMNYDMQPGYDLQVLDTDRHEDDKKSRDPATHMIVPAKGEAVKASKESQDVNDYLRAKAARCVRIANMLFSNQKVPASLIKRIATNLMDMHDNSITSTLDCIEKTGVEYKKPVLIEDWSEGEGLKVGESECSEEKKEEKESKKAKQVLVEDFTSPEGQKGLKEDNMGQMTKKKVSEGEKAPETELPVVEQSQEPTPAPVAPTEEAPVEEVPAEEPEEEVKEASVNEVDSFFDSLIASDEDEEKEEMDVTYSGDSENTDKMLAALFSDKEAIKQANVEGDRLMKQASAKKGIKKIATAPRATDMSASDLGSALFGNSPRDLF